MLPGWRAGGGQFGTRRLTHHDNDVRLGLLLPDEMNDGHDAVGDHVGSVSVIVCADQEDDNLRGKINK